MTNTVSPEIDAGLRGLFAAQRANRTALKARPADERKARLQKLREAIVASVDDITAALWADLRKAPMGLQTPEIGAVIKDIDDALAGLDEWVKPTAIASGPEYGGNDELSGWRMIGYAGDVQPRGWSDAEVTGA